MGVVYKAIDDALDRPVALKFLPPELTRDDDARLRLIQEAKAASALDHPNICTVHDIDTTAEGQLFIAMAFYDGETLKKPITKGPMTVVETLEVATQVAEGLAKAHAADIIHRDVKPANLMVTGDGVVKIVDFGIAKVVDQTGPTRPGVTLGTVTYMSPEQLEGKPIDGRSDIWSLGATMYEMLTGKPPFDGDNAFTVMKAIGTRDPVPLKTLRGDVPDALSSIVSRAMRRSPTERFSSATEMAQRLTRVPQRVYRRQRRGQNPWRAFKKSRVIAAAVIAAVVIAGGAGWALNRSATISAARERIPELTRLVEQDDYTGAFRLATGIERVLPDDPALRDLWPRFRERLPSPRSRQAPASRRATRTRPIPTATWFTPLAGVRVPLGMRRWRCSNVTACAPEFAFPAPLNARRST